MGAHATMTTQRFAAALVLDVPVDDVTLDEAVDAIVDLVRRGRHSGRTHQVATVNVDFLVQAVRDRAVHRILALTDLAVPDGMPVVWGARLLGTPLRQRTAGADLLPSLVARAAVDDLRICLFGGAAGVAARAAETLTRRHPAATVFAVEAPPVDADGTIAPSAADAVTAEIIRHDPDIVCVALGNPKQERWIDRYRSAVGAPVFIGVGGTLDFLTGRTRRAPSWMQRTGLEWLHRAAREPRRLLRRYLTDFAVFAPGLVTQMVRGRRRRCQATSLVVDELPHGLMVSLPNADDGASLDNRAAAELCAVLRDARRTSRQVIVAAGASRALRFAEEFGHDVLVR